MPGLPLPWPPPGAFLRLADRDAYTRGCGRCSARPGWPCTYTSGNNIHRHPVTGVYVPNVPGEPMLRVHHQRRKAGR